MTKVPTSTTPTRTRLQALPRSMRWLLVSGLCLLVFLFWSDYISPSTSMSNIQAQRILADVDDIVNGRSLAQQLKQKEEVIINLGSVQVPGASGDGANGLTRAVNEIRRAFTISNDDFKQGTGRLLPRAISRPITGSERVRIARLTGEYKFETTPENAIAIISALENHEAIEGISEVRMGRQSNRKVTVTLNLEAWVVQEQAGI